MDVSREMVEQHFRGQITPKFQMAYDWSTKRVLEAERGKVRSRREERVQQDPGRLGSWQTDHKRVFLVYELWIVLSNPWLQGRMLRGGSGVAWYVVWESLLAGDVSEVWVAQDQLLPMRSVGGWWQFLQRKGGESGRQGGRWKRQELFREWTWQAWVTTPSAFWSEWGGGTIQQKRKFKWEAGLGVKSDKCDFRHRHAKFQTQWNIQETKFTYKPVFMHLGVIRNMSHLHIMFIQI